jgi:hypothetical protein
MVAQGVRPAAAGDVRFSDTMQTARAKLAQIKTDLEHSSSAAAEEWEKIKCTALTCNILCWALPVFGWCCYCCEACNSPTAHYVHDICTMQKFSDLVQSMRKASPMLCLDISCGHYETRTTTDSEGRTETRTVYVETYSNHENFTGFSKVQDETPSAEELFDLVGRVTQQPCTEGDIMLVEVHVDALPVDEDSANKLFAYASRWYDQNMSDEIQHFSFEWTLNERVNSSDKMTMPSGNRCCVPISLDPASNPEWLSEDAFKREVCKGCAYCYRKKIFANSRKVELHVTKHFSMSAESAAIFPKIPPFSLRKAIPVLGQVMSSESAPAMTSSMESTDIQPPVHAAVPAEHKFCSECGTPSAGQAFCANCGKNQSSSR